ncbi:L-asparaginase 1-like [Asterias rubens]|uniref:L-asparaginase 1-like n=1 Tax=Asterias rubens TaxID=7604 RepID=UPI00145540AE|nr:L-asparaginase 1-like [Asterias rubens]
MNGANLNVRRLAMGTSNDGAGGPIRAPVRPKPRRSASNQIDGVVEETESRVLVLYAGGTIGMYKENGVYVSKPGYMHKLVRSLTMLHDEEYACQLEQTPEMAEKPFALPLSKGRHRVIYDIHEYSILKDSSNLNISDWVEMAEDIGRYYRMYDGFVILHGTDTMAYTSSALSFMLENLGKPVILTGAQVPLPELRSDGRDNMLGAIYIAGHYVIPEVTLYFNDKLYRGNRSAKVSCESFHCFDSLNFPPLVSMAVNIVVEWGNIFRPNTLESLNVHSSMESQVGLLRLFPGITKETVEAFLSPPLKGVVMQTYGVGNGPDERVDLIQAIKEATQRGVLIINCTQCAKGSVSATYRTGMALLDAGVVPGCDITPEAALTKLCYILGKKELSQAQQLELLGRNLRGEIKTTVENSQSLTLKDSKLIRAVVDTLRVNTTKEIKAVQDALFVPMMCAAAKNGDLASLQHFKSCGGDFTLADYDGRTPLHQAASTKNIEVVQYLLENGCSVHQKDSFGNTPFFESIRCKNIEVIKLIKKTGGHLMHSCANETGTILCHAAALDDSATLEAFHIAGVDINSTDYCGNTPLHVAVRKGSEASIRFLLEAGADTSVKDSHNATALCIAKEQGVEDVVKLLEGVVIS